MNTILYLTMLISVGLIALVRAKAHNAIKVAPDADSSCYYRKQFAIIRLLIVFLTGIIFVVILANMEKVSGLTIGLISGWSGTCFLLNFPAYAIRPTQIKDKHFVLYLRGFSRDNYSETTEDLQKTDKSDSFSEGRFIHLLKQYLPVYAVGMAKEFEAPHGANRVYLNDSDWEQEVEALMSRATLIVILLNESDSCIWEIRHARKYKDKIVYICDNQDKLVNVRQKLNVLRESGIPIGVKVDTATFSDTNGSASTVQISHTDKEYSMFIHKLMKDKFGLNRHIFSNRGIKKIATVTGIILAPVLIGYFMLLDMHPFFKGIEHPYVWLSIALGLFFIGPYIIREFMYRNKRNNIMGKLLETSRINNV